jgi:hypothetical protein
MELATLATIAVSYLVTEIKNSKGVKDASNEFSSAIWHWIRPIFLKDDQPVKDLQENPDDKLNQQEVNTKILKEITRNPNSLEELKKILEENGAQKSTITQYHSGSGDNVGGNKIVYGK